MKNLFKRFRLQFFDQSLNLHIRMLHLILMAGFLGSVVTFIFDLGNIHIRMLQSLSELGGAVVAAWLLYLSAFKGKHTFSAIGLVLVCNELYFPFMFFGSGGIHSGMVIWLVLGLIITFLVLEGAVCIIMYVINALTVLGLFLYEYKVPDAIVPLDKLPWTMDVMTAIVLVSIIFGAIFKYQDYVYKGQKEELKKQEESLIATNEELQQAMELLKNANKAKGDFLANMSHEIRTPINAVLGMNEIALRENHDSNLEQYLVNIHSAGNSLLAIINDILDFSKIESGKMEIVPGNYSLEKLINDCYHMVDMRAFEKNLHFVVENNNLLPSTLYGDEVRVRQIIINLLTNAVKYTKVGTITFSIDFEPLEKNKINLIVSVKDTGTGISETNQKLLFEEYNRVDLQNNKSIEGTGLGLAITHSLLEAMNGTIKVKSSLGVGSTFTITIPQEVVSDLPLGNFNSSNSKNKINKHQVSFVAPGAKVLVVDDVKMNLDVFCGLLKNTQINIDRASSGREAINAVEIKNYDMIFMDIMMPEMDGVHALQLIHLNANFRENTPVIALTANAIKGADKEYMEAGFTDYLSKPVQGSVLEQMILKYLPAKLISYPNKSNDTIAALNNQGNGVSVIDLSAYDKKQKILDPFGYNALMENSSDSETKNSTTEKVSFLDSLSFLDTAAGLKYCDNDENVYRMILENFQTHPQVSGIKDAYLMDDWAEYRVKAHAIKSTAQTIGATKFCELAKEIEYASRDLDIEYIRSHHTGFIDEYEKLLNQVRNALSL